LSIVVTAEAVRVAMAMGGLAGLLLGTIGALGAGGLIGGYLQWAVLSGRLRHAGWWIPATLAGTVLGYVPRVAVASLLPTLGGGAGTSGSPLSLWGAAVSWGVVVLGVAICQWLVLRRDVERAAVWVLAVPLAAAVVAIVTYPGSGYSGLPTDLAEAAARSGAQHAAGAMLTGAVLVWLLAVRSRAEET
jgi:hypothetical protein